LLDRGQFGLKPEKTEEQQDKHIKDRSKELKNRFYMNAFELFKKLAQDECLIVKGQKPLTDDEWETFRKMIFGEKVDPKVAAALNQRCKEVYGFREAGPDGHRIQIGENFTPDYVKNKIMKQNHKDGQPYSWKELYATASNWIDSLDGYVDVLKNAESCGNYMGMVNSRDSCTLIAALQSYSNDPAVLLTIKPINIDEINPEKTPFLFCLKVMDYYHQQGLAVPEHAQRKMNVLIQKSGIKYAKEEGTVSTLSDFETVLKKECEMDSRFKKYSKLDEQRKSMSVVNREDRKFRKLAKKSSRPIPSDDVLTALFTDMQFSKYATRPTVRIGKVKVGELLNLCKLDGDIIQNAMLTVNYVEGHETVCHDCTIFAPCQPGLGYCFAQNEVFRPIDRDTAKYLIENFVVDVKLCPVEVYEKMCADLEELDKKLATQKQAPQPEEATQKQDPQSEVAAQKQKPKKRLKKVKRCQMSAAAKLVVVATNGPQVGFGGENVTLGAQKQSEMT
jgi:hypothetical protein